MLESSQNSRTPPPARMLISRELYGQNLRVWTVVTGRHKTRPGTPQFPDGLEIAPRQFPPRRPSVVARRRCVTSRDPSRIVANITTLRLGAVSAGISLIVGLALLLTACGAADHQLTTGGNSAASPPKPRCLPSPLRVKPLRVRAGGTIVIQSAPFACKASYPAGKTYTLHLGQVGRGARLKLGVVPVKTNGAFKATVHISSKASPGEAYIIVRGSAFDGPCQDASSSCAGYEARLHVLAAR